MFGHYCRPPPGCKADGMTSVNVSIATRNHSYSSKDVASATQVLLGIIHYQDLEDALNRTYTMEDNR